MVFIFNSCEQKNLPPELVGKWKTGKVEITVRNRLERGKYEFTADTATITLIIDSSYTASGFIGSEKFENIRIGAYNTDDENVKRGFEYFVNPFVVGKIFANDPNADKEVIFKLNLLEETTIKSELCNRDFTMAEIIFTKEED
jgi:hypothetical protein